MTGDGGDLSDLYSEYLNVERGCKAEIQAGPSFPLLGPRPANEIEIDRIIFEARYGASLPYAPRAVLYPVIDCGPSRQPARSISRIGLLLVVLGTLAAVCAALF